MTENSNYASQTQPFPQKAQGESVASNSGSQNVVPGSTASVSLGNVLETQSHGHNPRGRASESLGVGTVVCLLQAREEYSLHGTPLQER